VLCRETGIETCGSFLPGARHQEDGAEAGSSWSSPGMFLLFQSWRQIICCALSQLTELGTLFCPDPPNQDNHFPLPGMKQGAPAMQSPGAGQSQPEDICLTGNVNEDRNFFITSSSSTSSLAVYG